MKATVKGRYKVDRSSTSTTFAVNTGDLKLKASMTDASFVHSPSLNGLALSVEKLGSFIIDYNVPKKDVRFQFTNSVRAFDKTVNLTYTHASVDNHVNLDGSMSFDLANKVSVNHALGSGNWQFTHLKRKIKLAIENKVAKEYLEGGQWCSKNETLALGDSSQLAVEVKGGSANAFRIKA
ncbi:outer envelope pore protein 24B, chloroplastic-like [Phoenix dactylifera]|uniref:Outer envelope pore protein 24B, chloroplastic-like n=1 Tax=Phoenix dactylifera TaxID=42345 RepID=A0A8B9AD50_PHODC|nr:outer envelope pore protein 24B, chloroplastic-like [Phoenix dactylifera]